MLSPEARDALALLTASVAASPKVGDALRARWAAGSRDGSQQPEVELPDHLREPADQFASAMATLSRSEAGEVAALGELFAQPEGDVLYLWCDASVWRRDAQLAALLALAATQSDLPLAGPGDCPRSRRRGPAPRRARLRAAPRRRRAARRCRRTPRRARGWRSSIWEAGASALEVPDLGNWLWGSHATFEAMIRGPAHGALARPRARRALSRGERARDAADDRSRARRAGRSRCCSRCCSIPSRSCGCTPRARSAVSPARRAARGHAARLGPRRVARSCASAR